MNGRMYDPLVSRFLSPDPYIQDHTSTLNYNRYSYCLNNPLKYADPSGNIAYTYWRDDRSGYDGAPFNVDFSFSNHSGGGAGGSSIGAYSYDWNSGGYSNGWGNDVSYSEVHNNYIIPNGASLPGNTDLSSISFGKNSKGVGGIWYQTVNLVGSYQDWNDGVRAKNSQLNVINAFTAFGAARQLGMPGWASDVNTGVNAFGVANSAKTGLIDYAVRSNYKSATSWSQFNKLRATQQAWRATNTLGKTGASYLKYAKGLGYVGAGLTTAYSAANAGMYYYNGGTDWQVGTKATLDMIMTGVGFLGPIGFGISATYFILDATTSGYGGFGAVKP